MKIPPLMDKNERIARQKEEALFELAGVKWVDPEKREVKQ